MAVNAFPRRSFLNRRRLLAGLASLPVLGLLGGCGALPIEPPVPDPNGFDEIAARDTLLKAQTLAAAGDAPAALIAYKDALYAWPVLTEAWGGLRRLAETTGDRDDERLAVFFEGRAEEYQAVHPLQARMAFRGLAEAPPADPPALGRWAKRFVDFFTYRDAIEQRNAWDLSRSER